MRDKLQDERPSRDRTSSQPVNCLVDVPCSDYDEAISFFTDALRFVVSKIRR
jgi:hypothetical protein